MPAYGMSAASAASGRGRHPDAPRRLDHAVLPEHQPDHPPHPGGPRPGRRPAPAARKLQDLQVSVEVRFITVSDNFFEQIGVDFDFDPLGEPGSITRSRRQPSGGATCSGREPRAPAAARRHRHTSRRRGRGRGSRRRLGGSRGPGGGTTTAVTPPSSQPDPRPHVSGREQPTSSARRSGDANSQLHAGPPDPVHQSSGILIA